MLEVDKKHASGLKPAFVKDPIWGNIVEHADFRGHDHEVVFGDVVARRTQAVAVEHRPDAQAIGEGNRGRAVPGLHQRGVIFVKCFLLRAHRLMAAPRLGNHHHHGVGQGSTRERQHFQGVVEHGRVAAVRIDDRQNLSDVLAEKFRGKQTLAGVHPIDVAAQRIDLAVVADIAIGMGPRPVRKGVRAKAGMDHGQSGLNGGVRHVRVINRNLVGLEHPFIDDGLAGKTGNVKHAALGDGRPFDGVFDALADDVQLPLEGEGIRPVAHAPGSDGLPADEDLSDRRLCSFGRGPNRRTVGRHGPPA